jgi:hypothetical protein
VAIRRKVLESLKDFSDDFEFEQPAGTGTK